ncbi:RNA exonuclease 4 [Nannizzia gypsea CBS 118893]|uniref:RNA exonuclease 4 n=1 Tax=Arthroderma gypseum (strain ATCC MYA-4604 / CBS 118893) TaxID=535722 RepID=E4UR33_ARTGP|nr:RNA exonuclease 4 [Nannizzia gypsea CBS 118893]EFR00148.1 RNA exonuclease 4 [Nannizzia gypsea CBS 118893]
MLALRPAATNEKVQKPEKSQTDQEKMPRFQPHISSSQTAMPVSMNILPCRIHHDGSIEASKRHWNPVRDEGTDEISTAYFRGRKLRGRPVLLPDGYHGLVVTKLPQNETAIKRIVGDENVDEENEEPLSQLETVGTFSTLTVWEHEKLPTDDDVYVRSMEEWVSFAHSIHDDGTKVEQLEN